MTYILPYTSERCLTAAQALSSHDHPRKQQNHTRVHCRRTVLQARRKSSTGKFLGVSTFRIGKWKTNIATEDKSFTFPNERKRGQAWETSTSGNSGPMSIVKNGLEFEITIQSVC